MDPMKNEEARVSEQEKLHNANRNGGPRKRGCCGRGGHCGRFWWVYVVALIVITAILVPVIIFVAVPKLAQKRLDESTLVIDGIAVSNPQTNQITMSINATIGSDGSIKAELDAFNGTMYLEDVGPSAPFATIEFPASKAGGVKTINVTQDLPVTSDPAFGTFNKWLVANESLRVTVQGDTYIHVSGIYKAFPVVYKKTIELKGFNSFAGISVDNTTFSARDSLGDNFHGLAKINNPTIFTIEIGNATFANFLNGENIGTVNLDNMVLRPGMNSVAMRANVSEVPVITTVTKRPYCETGKLPFVLTGRDVVNNGQHIGYFADALAASNQTISMDIAKTLEGVVPIQCPLT